MEKRKGKEWTKDEDRQLKDLFNKGYSYEFIAKKIDRTWFGVKCRMQRLNLIPQEGFTKQYKDSAERFVCPRDKYNGMSLCTDTDNIDNLEKLQLDVFASSVTLRNVMQYLVMRYNLYNDTYVLSDYLLGGCEAKRGMDAMLHEIKIVKQLMNMTVQQRKEAMKKFV